MNTAVTHVLNNRRVIPVEPTVCMVLFCGLMLSSCSAPSYPPPPQIVLPDGPEPALSWDDGAGLLLGMADPNADARIVQDVVPSGNNAEWRFTGIHPQFRLQVRAGGKLSFYMRFFLHEESLRARGPITFKVNINGNSFQSYPFKQGGDIEYTNPIPESWVPGPGEVHIALDVDPPWRFPDGTAYGILLHSIGFVKRDK